MDRRTERVLLLLLIIAAILYFSRRAQQPHLAPEAPVELSLSGIWTDGAVREQPVQLRNLEPANSTLGFGVISAVSRAGSPRQPGLFLASNISEIDITVVDQPVWTDEDLDRLYAEKDSMIGRGSAMAWLGHLNTLRWFLESDLETILIFEDDVDWDINLRTVQVPAAAAAVRRLTSMNTDPLMPADYDPQLGNYWGNTSSWDLLYLGHCGDIFRPDAWTDNVARVTYPDRTLLPFPQLHPYTAKFLQTINIPQGTRVVHSSIFPLCTFGFALTRRAAHRLLYDLAAREEDGGTHAYDVAVLEACRDSGLRCFSVNPELFHHIESESEIASVDFDDFPEDEGEGDGEDKPEKVRVGADENGRLKPLRGGMTPNIACPIRSKYFFTEDPTTLAFLRDEVGRKGICLKDVMEEDVGRIADQDPDFFHVPDDFHDPRLDPP